MVTKGLLFIISAPSGAGKSTLVKALIARDERFIRPVSYTTRTIRPGEKQGRDYHFVSLEKFKELSRQGHFLEEARVHGAYYATSKKEVERVLKEGKYALLPIDVQGARTISQCYGQDSVRVFILPPDEDALYSRLRKRKESQITERLAHARIEMQEIPFFDYCLINDDLKQAIKDLLAIVRAEELRRLKNQRMAEMVPI